MRIGVSQSNYLPWLGFFSLINSVETFVIYDSAQFTKNDWRNRNRIRSANGPFWLTIPCLTSGRLGQPIDTTQVKSPDWVRKHVASIRNSYGRSRHFSWFEDYLFPVMMGLEGETGISSINVTLIRGIAHELGIPTRIITDREFVLEGDPNAKLLSICGALRASVYVSGPSGANYLDVARFSDEGVRVEFTSYDLVDQFLHDSGNSIDERMSVVDTIACVGLDDLRDFLGSLRSHG